MYIVKIKIIKSILEHKTDRRILHPLNERGEKLMSDDLQKLNDESSLIISHLLYSSLNKISEGDIYHGFFATDHKLNYTARLVMLN